MVFTLQIMSVVGPASIPLFLFEAIVFSIRSLDQMSDLSECMVVSKKSPE